MKLATAQKTRKAICFKFDVSDHRAATSDSAIEKRPEFAAPVPGLFGDNHKVEIGKKTLENQRCQTR